MFQCTSGRNRPRSCQCAMRTPTGTPVSVGTFNTASGAATYTGIATGSVVTISTAISIVINVDMCATNLATNVPDGTNDSFVTLLNASYTPIGSIADGCANMLGGGTGPSVGSLDLPVAGTYYLFVTEYDINGDCLDNGANSAYVMSINTLTAPSNDDCANALVLPVVNGVGACLGTTYSSADATESAPADSCARYLGNADDDMYFSFVATASALNIDLQGG